MGLYEFFQDIANQVSKYSNFAGQLWYLLTFLFRIFVVVTLGSAVYGDEQSQFKCSQALVGCNQACYNQFTEISHLRFWGFQLLAVSAPIVAFHFLTTYLVGELEKISDVQDRLDKTDLSEAGFKDARHRDYEERKMQRRQRMLGGVKWKRTYAGGKLNKYPINDKIRLSYFIAAVIRLVLEGYFLYLTHYFYNYPDYLCMATEIFKNHPGGLHPPPPDVSKCLTNGTLSFLWAGYPETYPCHRKTDPTGVDIACSQHIAFGSVVPCWTSRAYEKTVFLRYMNIISSICFLLCCIEMVVVPFKYFNHKSAKNNVQIIYRDYDDKTDEIAMNPINHQLTTLRSQQSLPYNTPQTNGEYPPLKETYVFEETSADVRPMHPPPNDVNVKTDVKTELKG